MHTHIYRAFERICSRHEIGGSVLEIGAVPSKNALLAMPALSGAKERVGINLKGGRGPGFEIVEGNANEMSQFETDRFELVLSNAVLEHDPYFWRTLEEIRRVTKPGGMIIIGVPGYRTLAADRLQGRLSRMSSLRRVGEGMWTNALMQSTLTFRVHSGPGDYYRFSPQAIEEVFLEGLDDVTVTSVMLPPRLIGYGVVPA